MTSSDSHDPLPRAISTARRPASAIRPAASRRATRSLFERAQVLVGLRGANRCIDRSSSARPRTPSIQPKHRASSTASSYVTVGLPVCLFQVTSHTPDSRAWCSASQARQAALDSGWTRGSSAMAPVSGVTSETSGEARLRSLPSPHGTARPPGSGQTRRSGGVDRAGAGRHNHGSSGCDRQCRQRGTGRGRRR